MPTRRLGEAEMISVLEEEETGQRAGEVARPHASSERT